MAAQDELLNYALRRPGDERDVAAAIAHSEETKDAENAAFAPPMSVSAWDVVSIEHARDGAPGMSCRLQLVDPAYPVSVV